MNKNLKFIEELNISFDNNNNYKKIYLNEAFYTSEFTFNEKYMIRYILKLYFKKSLEDLDYFSASHITVLIFNNQSIEIYQKPDFSF